jgi:cell shape-determining protein MreC
MMCCRRYSAIDDWKSHGIVIVIPDTGIRGKISEKKKKYSLVIGFLPLSFNGQK